MARVTVEDCLEQVPSRFWLVVMTSVRTKQLMRGAKPLVQAGENRSVVTALREVAAGLVKADVEPEGPPSDAEPEAETAED
jgi:DNA-directed RNA polymerase subunit omega